MTIDSSRLRTIRYTAVMLLALVASRVAGAQRDVKASELLREFAATQERFRSCMIACEIRGSGKSPAQDRDSWIHTYDLRLDGRQGAMRCHRLWSRGDVNDMDFTKKAGYLSLVWDGQSYTNFRKEPGTDPGHFTIISTPPEWDLERLCHSHRASILMGICEGDTKRIDVLFREASSLSVRAEKEAVGSFLCHVIDAETRYGRYRVWLDPDHGESPVRIEVRRANGDILYEKPMEMREWSWTLEVSRFMEVGEGWLGAEAESRVSSVTGDGRTDSWSEHIRVLDFQVNPDHGALRSFQSRDIQNGAEGWIHPHHHLRYRWQDGQYKPQFDANDVTVMNSMVSQILLKDGAPSSITAADPDKLLLASNDAIPTPRHKRRSPRVEASDPNAGNGAATGPAPADAHSSPAEPNQPGGAASRGTFRKGRALRPHCGLYCVYCLLKMAQKEVAFEELLKPAYVGSPRGSSLSELKRAILDHGLFAGPAAKMTARVLRDTPYPLILHVKSALIAKEYDHYILFLGCSRGKARIFDPPAPPATVPFAELVPLWDGYGMVVSAVPIQADLMFGRQLQRLLSVGLAVGIAIIAMHILRLSLARRLSSLRAPRKIAFTALQAGMLGVAAVVCGVCVHFLDDDQGFLANAPATKGVQTAYARDFIPRLHIGQVRRLLGTDTLFIDARLKADYEQGHLSGAINLPVDVNDAQMRKRTSAWPVDSRIVVYCESPACGYSEDIAMRLINLDFQNVSIFRGGWQEWTEKAPHARESESPQPESKREGNGDEAAVKPS